MNTRKKEALRIVGIEVKTINEPGKADQDIPALWGRFMAEGISDKITNKVSDETYCVYCKYESDHTAPYTTMIGHAIPASATIPEGLKAIEIPASNYAVYTSKGDLVGGAVIGTWMEIWQDQSTERTYTADFEIYGEGAKNPNDGEIEIFVGIK